MYKTIKKINIHFIGVGGIGMSGLAEVLLNLGYSVSGSDVSDSSIIERLRSKGVKIYIGHRAENVLGANVVVYSSAIKDSNPEVKNARDMGLPILQRAQMLAELMRLKHGVAIAGTHGKTTTTSFIATILKEANLDPTHIIGGVVENLGGNAHWGRGSFLVAEADESDGSFLLLSPTISVITNIEKDHMEYYNTEENLFNSFVTFANRVPFYGRCVLNLDDAGVKKVISRINRPISTFGVKGNAESYDFFASNITYDIQGTSFDLWHVGKLGPRIHINIPGEHNVYNALAAIAVATELEIPFDEISSGISKCRGVGRRFDIIFSRNKFSLIDDYAHHPTEVLTTLKTAKEISKGEPVVAIFQPHRYSRLKDCWAEFLHCFNYVDKLWITPVYSAGESPIEGISTEYLVRDINKLHPNLALEIKDLSDIKVILNEWSQKNGFFICLGAGSLSKVIRDWTQNKCGKA